MRRDHNKVESIFARAITIGSLAERAAFLASACGDDSDLLHEVEELLEAFESSTSLLEKPLTLRDIAELTGQIRRLGQQSEADREAILARLERRPGESNLGWILHYRVHCVLGQGSMGVVLRARDTKLNRNVAIKFLAPHLAGDSEARSRFLREARAMAAIKHENVVGVFVIEGDGQSDNSVEHEPNIPYIVMEYVDGQSLRERLKRGSNVPVEDVVRFGSQIAAGLAAAHGEGLIHRDIKPANLLIESSTDRIKITDFGLAIPSTSTSLGEVGGTPSFMAPEQLNGDHVDHRSDLFSLGCVLYAMCAGKSPFAAANNEDVFRQICQDCPDSLRAQRPDVPRELATLIEQLLCKDPNERPSSAEEVVEQLRNTRSSGVDSAPRRLANQVAGFVVKRGRVLAIGVAVLGCAIVGMWAWRAHDRYLHEIRFDLFDGDPRCTLVSKDGTEIFDEPDKEGRIRKYWRATTPKAWGSVVYRLEFSRPIDSCKLLAPLAVYHQFDPLAQANLEVSGDAVTWKPIRKFAPVTSYGIARDNVPASPGWGTEHNVQPYEITAFDSRIRGQTHFFVRARLYSRSATTDALFDWNRGGVPLNGEVNGPNGPVKIGPAYAQFLRSYVFHPSNNQLVAKAVFLAEPNQDK